MKIGYDAMLLAGPWRRLAAWTIDLLLLLTVVGALEIVIFAGCTGEGCLAALAPIFLAPWLSPLYSIPSIHLLGRTLGMRTVGLTTQTASGSLPTWGRSSLRWLVGNGPLILPIFGWIFAVVVRLPILWDAERRGLHDRAAGTLVLSIPDRRR